MRVSCSARQSHRIVRARLRIVGRAAALLSVLVALEGVGAADESSNVVGVLPLATDDGLALYSQPVADALATRLRSTGARVEPLSLSGKVPGRITLVVDGRIARVSAKRIVLEARVRDPRRGRVVVNTITTAGRPLADIDKLAAGLARKLAPRLAVAVRAVAKLDAAEAKARRHQRVIRLPTSIVRGVRVSTKPAAPTDRRRPIVVFQSTGPHSDSGIVTRHAYWLAERLGRRPLVGPATAIENLPAVRKKTAGSHGANVAQGAVVSILARRGAVYGLFVQVLEVEFEWHGVLMAHGRVRVVLVDARGRRIFDRVARTGTLIGSRGDGPDALLHFVAEQAVDIVFPHLRRALAASRAKRSRPPVHPVEDSR